MNHSWYCKLHPRELPDMKQEQTQWHGWRRKKNGNNITVSSEYFYGTGGGC